MKVVSRVCFCLSTGLSPCSPPPPPHRAPVLERARAARELQLVGEGRPDARPLGRAWRLWAGSGQGCAGSLFAQAVRGRQCGGAGQQGAGRGSSGRDRAAVGGAGQQWAGQRPGLAVVGGAAGGGVGPQRGGAAGQVSVSNLSRMQDSL